MSAWTFIQALILLGALSSFGNCPDLLTGDSPPSLRSLLRKVDEKLASSDLANPLRVHAGDADKVGEALLNIRTHYPLYQEIREALNSAPPLTEEQSKAFSDRLMKDVQRFLSGSQTDLWTGIGLGESLKVFDVLRARMVVRSKDSADPQDEQEEEEEGTEPDLLGSTPDQYQPGHTRLNPGKKAKRIAVIRTNALSDKRLIRKRTHEHIGPDHWTTLETLQEDVQVEPKPTKFLEVRPNGHRTRELTVPYQYAVGEAPAGTQIERRGTRTLLRFKEDPPASISLPLHKIIHISFPSLELLRTPTGIPKNSWPKEILTWVREQASTPLPAAERIRQIAHFLHHDYGMKYYSEGGDFTVQDLDAIDRKMAEFMLQYSKPVAMARVKAANCDGFAHIVAALARDFFGVACRVAAGTTVSYRTREDGVILDVVDTGSSPHAWVEALQSDSIEEIEVTPPHSLGDAPLEPLFNDDDQLPFLERALMEFFLEMALKQGYEPASAALDNLLKGESPGLNVQRAIAGAHRWLETVRSGSTDLRALKTRFESLRQHLLHSEITESWKDVLQALRELDALASLRPLRTSEQGAQTALLTLKNHLLTYRSQDSGRYELALDFFNELPGSLSRRIITNRYGTNLLDLGTPAFDVFAKDLLAGKLQFFDVMRKLVPKATLSLKSRPESSLDEQTLFSRARTPQRPFSDIVIAERIEELPYFILDVRPGEHFLERFLRGQQLALGELETELVEGTHNPTRKKVVFIHYDVTGSMEMDTREPIRTQDALLAAIVDISMNERDPLGRLMQEVIATPFGLKPHHEKTFYLIQGDNDSAAHLEAKAMAWIESLERNPTPASDGGTDIEATILDFYGGVHEHVARTEKNEKVLYRLSEVNHLLITDGGSEIDQAKLAEAESKLPSSIKVYKHLIGINFDNQALDSLVSTTGYSEPQKITKDEMQKLWGESAAPEVSADAFIQDRPHIVVPAAISDVARRLSAQLPELRGPVCDEIYSALDDSQAQSYTHFTPSQSKALSDLLYLTKVFRRWKGVAQPIREKIVDKIFSNYVVFMNHSLEQRSMAEHQALTQLRQWREAP